MPADQIETLWMPAFDPNNPKARFPGFNPREEILKAGSRKSAKSKPLPCGIIWKVDVPVRLRDGVIIYIDIFLPEHALAAAKIPAIVAWSPYGKQGGLSALEDFPSRMGVKEETLSGYQKWEGPDPAYWCAKGYAVINPEARGAYSSEGDIQSFGEAEAKDAYDLIEWLAIQDWCNGKVGLAGNSWLAISQWFIAASRPPHLAAIAPWEGFTDVYRHHAAVGGIPDVGFMESIFPFLAGNGRVENVPGMIKKYPLFNAYWDTKCAKVEDIEVPAYVVASWSNPLHTPGTFEGWSRLRGNDKWLRVHDSHEWYDFYNSQDDLARFFAKYLKGENNGWESTPKIRLFLLNNGKKPRVECMTLTQFPQDEAERVYIDDGFKTLSCAVPGQGAGGVFKLQGNEQLKLRYEFKERTAVIGPIKICLHLSLEEGGDADVSVKALPLDKNGRVKRYRTAPIKDLVGKAITNLLRLAGSPLHRHFFYDGSWGKLRVSHRSYDRNAGNAFTIAYTHQDPLFLKKDEIVKVDLMLTPMGLEFEAGEALQFIITERDLSPMPIGKRKKTPAARNKGIKIFAAGKDGSYSRIDLPILRQ
jgi:predicted acyl esterase